MNRRKLLSRLTILSGGALLATTGLLSSCNFLNKKRTTITEKDIPLLDEIGETIIPTTASSPGAKAAKIGFFMVTMVNDCYSDKQKTLFIEGLNTFDALCQQQYNTSFIELNQINKKKFLVQLDEEAKQLHEKKIGGTQPSEHYFTMLKNLTIKGYFTSEIGATKALRYEPVPGKFEGCITYKKGDKPWAIN